MLGPTHDIPLPPVATDLLSYNNETYDVLESEVLLEISNGNDILTVRRQIKGSQNSHLINVWKGAMLSETINSYISNDYIVREPGGARKLGFHNLLAEFIGWSLPEVKSYEEKEVLLYVETLFPLMFVEQKRGWSNLRNRFPGYLKIKDVSRRVFEFILSLDAQEIANQKITLDKKLENIKLSWKEKLHECNLLLYPVNATITNLPGQPTSTWPPSTQPRILVAQDNDQWIDINQVLILLKERLGSLESQEIPRTDQVLESAQIELDNKENQRSALEAELTLKFEQLQNKLTHIKEIESRISSLQEELKKSQDLKKLSNLGSVQGLQTYSGSCPTCHQSISDSLIPSREVTQVMTVDQNAQFIRQQLKIFEAMKKNEEDTLDLSRRQLNALRSCIADIRKDICALKTTLTSQNNAPSYASVEARVRLNDKITSLTLVRNQVDQLLGNFSDLAEKWHEAKSALSHLPKGILSQTDISKINCLESSFQEQLEKYGFDSLDYTQVTISPNSYFPQYEGFDLNFDVSASDYIRVVWAYLLGLLDVSRHYHTNHPGLLLFDEPRQQSAGETSIKAFLNQASSCQQYGQQVIVATSESKELLEKHLQGIPHTYIRFDDKIIAPL